MTSRTLLFGALMAGLCFMAGLFTHSQLVAREDVPAASAWQYKAVDLQFEILSIDGKLPSNPFAAALDVEGTTKRLEAALAKHGAGGWELVSYSGGTAIYKQAVKA